MMLSRARLIRCAVGAACVLGSSAVVAQATTPEADPSLTTKLPSAGIAEFDRMSVDLGKVMQRQHPKFQYTITNKGTGPLAIQKVQPQCGCTASNKAELEGKVLQVGESAVISAEFDSTGKKGKVVKHITVVTDDAKNPNVQLEFSCLVEPVVIVDPEMANFASVAKGENKTLKVTVTGRTPDFAVTNVSVTRNETFETKILGTEAIERDGEKFRSVTLEVTIKTDKIVGRVSDQLVIRTNDPNDPQQTIGLMAQVVGDLKADPVTLTFPAGRAGETVTGQITLSNRKGQAFKVEKVESRFADKSAATTLELSATPDNPDKPTSWVIKASGQLPQGSARLSGQVLITTDVPGEQQIAVPFYALIRAAAATK